MTQDLVKCYGKKKICPERDNCELGECCLSAANEDSDGIHFHHTHITENNILDTISQPGSENFIYENDQQESEVVFQDAESEILRRLTGEDRAEILDIVRELAYLYFNCPNTFNVLLRRIYKNETQSDIARKQSLSRQCLNLRLHRELGIGKRKAMEKQEQNAALLDLQQKDSFLQSLSARDYQIYKIRFVDGCTAAAAAKIIGCDIRTIFRVTHYLRTNLNLECHKNGRPKKENAKKYQSHH